ncbi:MAG: cell wall-binding repeat-containing protein [Desulfosporosinus sp.]|nr:cell wall-binding repeat-containing protein [Desulfosporosinus sp.]
MRIFTSKKTLASLVIAGMALTMAPFNAFADTGVTTARLFGSDRIGTSTAVADAGWTTANTAILAPSDDADLVDALLAAPLAGKTAPILLTDSNALTPATQAELVKLGVKNVYVVGAINQAVVDQVNAISGVTTTVLSGSDSIAVATAIAAKLTNPAGSFVVGHSALADALSVASYAAANNYSILVANTDGSLPASETAYKGATTYIIGGPTLVADIPGATRLFGADRFATNLAVLNALAYKYDHVYVANGTDGHLVDSLVASSLAAESGAPIVLNDTNGDGSIASTSINSKLTSTAVVTALGGHTLVTDADVAQITTNIIYLPIMPPVVVTPPVITPPVVTAPISLGAGTFTIGKNIAPGRYTITTPSGSGNFVVQDKSGMPVVNEILGNGSLGVKKVIATLPDGDSINISGLSEVDFALYQPPAIGTSPVKTDEGAGEYTVGIDIPAGRYVVSVNGSGSGNFVVMGTDGMPKTNEILGGDMGVKNVTVDLNNNDVINISGMNDVVFEPTN